MSFHRNLVVRNGFTRGPTEMNDDFRVEADIRHQVIELLQHLATVANEADALGFHAPQQDGQLAGQLRDAVCKMGWMADLALAKLGEEPIVGGAERWLLPPSYHWTPGAPRATRHDSP
jgi:hypothetical protein